MARRKAVNDDGGNPLYTIVGVGIILGVVAFIGFVKPKESPPLGTSEPVRELANIAPPIEVPAAIEEPEAIQQPIQQAEVPNEVELEVVKAPEPVEIGKLLQQRAVQESAVVKVVTEPPQIASTRDPLNDGGNFSFLPFGRDAVIRCESTCNGSESCLLNCRRLMAGEFARRILPKDPEPKELAFETVTRCRKAGWLGQSPIREEDKTTLRALVDPPEVFEPISLSQRFNQANPFFSKLTGAKSDSMGEFLCLLEALTTTELAIAVVAEGGDAHSELFYREMETVLYSAMMGIRSNFSLEWGI